MLPPELLLHIFSYLPQSSLYAISLTSKHFHHLSTPIIYQSPTIKKSSISAILNSPNRMIILSSIRYLTIINIPATTTTTDDDVVVEEMVRLCLGVVRVSLYTRISWSLLRRIKEGRGGRELEIDLSKSILEEQDEDEEMSDITTTTTTSLLLGNSTTSIKASPKSIQTLINSFTSILHLNISNCTKVPSLNLSNLNLRSIELSNCTKLTRESIISIINPHLECFIAGRRESVLFQNTLPSIDDDIVSLLVGTNIHELRLYNQNVSIIPSELASQLRVLDVGGGACRVDVASIASSLVKLEVLVVAYSSCLNDDLFEIIKKSSKLKYLDCSGNGGNSSTTTTLFKKQQSVLLKSGAIEVFRNDVLLGECELNKIRLLL